MTEDSGPSGPRRRRWMGRARLMRGRGSALPPPIKGMLWMILAGLTFSVMNAMVREMTLQLDHFQAQFMRWSFSALIFVPLVLRDGLAAYMPRHIGGQFLRGGVHTMGVTLWFTAVGQIPLADMTAISFTAPLFSMVGAAVFLREPMRWERWLAVAVGFFGILLVLGPKLSGGGGIYNLVMLASAPIFAASALITKRMTSYESPSVIVSWQAITVAVYSLPLALLYWQTPTLLQTFVCMLSGFMGAIGHYFMTRSFIATDLSATQAVKFLELLWAVLLGWLIFGDVSTESTLIGGAVICASTLWVAHREARHSRLAPTKPPPH